MVLSSTGLVEINATTLRVLKDGQLVDVLTLTSGGGPDAPLGNLVVGQISGLQTQLNAKASTAALSAAAVSLAAEIDTLEEDVSALGDAVTVVGTAVMGLGASVDTKASTTSVSALASIVATKQDMLADSLDLGPLRILADSDVAFLKHDGGIAFQTIDSLTYAVFDQAGATVKKIVVQEELVLPDNAIQLAKVSGLSPALAGLEAGLATKQDAVSDTLDVSSDAVTHRVTTTSSGHFEVQRQIDGVFSMLLRILYNIALGTQRMILLPLRLRMLRYRGI